ncbi:hypothetical protein Q0590_37175 [Rhodocytophaga aerolata]|uniref:Uncharacterized protein n=1 Tax=Rhodocytophaga aerolata TaxID=455078 RepID=A0ABT8RJH0_9BACT|nr:hypothetical protein [Rhodocytophaga aerolata]MDO1451961.1 hypothetical protein [Rhodocytophaga aerolata]
MIIPLSNLLLGAVYSYGLNNRFPTKDFFDVILLQLIIPYISGVIVLLWLSIYKATNDKENRHDKINPKDKSLADMLDMEVVNFENYAKCTFIAWAIYVVPLVYNIIK